MSVCRQCLSACAEGVSGESSPGSKERGEERAKERKVRTEVLHASRGARG